MTATTKSGARDARDHGPFGSGHLHLVLGQDPEGNISHIGDVASGLACDCICPACGDPLIAKQGDVRAWHFAHANGAECRHAQSVSLAQFLRCKMSGWERLLLPEDSLQWGRTRIRIRAARLVVVRAEGTSPSRALKVASADGGDPIRISFKTQASQREDRGDETCDLLEIDLSNTSTEVFACRADLLEHILLKAPRKWLVTAASATRKAALQRERLGPALAALSQAGQGSPVPTKNCSSPTLGRLHLETFVKGAPIAGEAVFGTSREAWRSAAFEGLAIRPWLTAGRTLLVTEAAFGKAAIDHWLRTSGVTAFDDREPLFTRDDRIELADLCPGYRPSSDVLEDYLVELCRRDAIHASARMARHHTEIPDAFVDHRLDPLREKDWILAPRLIEHITRMKLADQLLAEK